MKNYVTLIFALAVLGSCVPKKENKDAENEQKVIHDIDQLVADLPNPAEIPYTLQSIEAPFTDSLVNRLENVDKYKDNYDKLAMNMGVYVADVSYLAAYNQPDLTMQYVKTCHKIGEILGDSALFKEDLLTNIENSLNDHDKLAEYLRGMIVETSVQLEKDHHLSMAALALGGALIEELFQAVNVIENYHMTGLTSDQEKVKIEPLVKLVLGQGKPLADLIQLFEDIPHDDTILSMLTQLKILDGLYKGELETIEQKMEADPNYVVDRAAMLGVTLEIERIRRSIVN